MADTEQEQEEKRLREQPMRTLRGQAEGDGPENCVRSSSKRSIRRECSGSRQRRPSSALPSGLGGVSSP